MKVLFVYSGNVSNMPFIGEQADSLKKSGVTIDHFVIKGKGIFGYLKNLFGLKSLLIANDYDLIHAHYGLAGLLTNLQRKVPVITTYHGSDINLKNIRLLSLLAVKLSNHNIFVSDRLYRAAGKPKKSSTIPCGVDIQLFCNIEQNLAKDELGFSKDKKYILFTSKFSNPVKNFPLAKQSLDILNDDSVELIEMSGRSRREVALLMNACDVLLMTSFAEGSPQVVKEALACNLPVVSTNVGDVVELLDGISNSYITTFDGKDIAAKLKLVLDAERLCETRSRMFEFSLDKVASRILTVYQKVSVKE